MFDFVKKIDEGLFHRVLDVLNAYENRNASIYVLIQSAFESFLKRAISDKSNRSYMQPKDGLGQLLNYKFVNAILKYDLKISDEQIKEISALNSKGNSFKHDQYIKFVSADCLMAIELLYDVFSKYYHTIFEDSLPPFNKDYLHEKEPFEAVVESNIQLNIDNLLSQQKDRLNSLLEENEKLSKDNQQLVKKEKEIEKNLFEYEKLKSEFVQLSSKYVSLQESLTDDNSTDEDEVADINAHLEFLKEKLQEFKDDDLVSNDIRIHNNMLQIMNNSQRAEETLRVHEDLKRIVQHKKENVYNGYEEISRYLSISIPYGYTGSHPFSILGVSQENRNESKYGELYAVVHNQLCRGYYFSPSEYLTSLELNNEQLIIVYKLQMSLLALMKNGQINDQQWNINLLNNDSELLRYAIEDIFKKMIVLSKLSKIDYKLPMLNILNDFEIVEGFYNISFDVVYPKNSNVLTISNKYNKDRKIQLWLDKKINYKIDDENKEFLLFFLQELFGFKLFKHGQIEILINALNGNSTIGILTTSGGKSLIYQFYALMQPKLTVVVDPINSIIHDQHRMLEKFNINHSMKLIEHKVDDQLISAREKMYEFFDNPSLFSFCSPERFQNREFRNWLILQANDNQIGLIVLDEVHCLSEWGHDFRIPYLMLTHTINTYCKNIQYLGLTATAAINVIKDLQVELGIFEPKNVVYSRNLQRDNLYFHIRQERKYESMISTLYETLKQDYQNSNHSFSLQSDEKNGYIIFFKRIDQLKEMQTLLSEDFYDEITIFHGSQKNFQEDFIENRKTLLLSTKAFGMGIDKPNIRKTIHFGMPQSREAFFQEAGRAGRDDKPATCLLLTFQSDMQSAAVVEEFLDLNTSISDLIALQKKIGRDKQNDLSTIAYFLTKDIDEPEKEANDSVMMFKFLLNNRSNYNIKFKVTNSKLNRYQKSFYILHKIGVIRNWLVRYVGGVNFDSEVEFDLHLNPKMEDIDHIKEETYNYIHQYSPNSKYLEELYFYTSLDDLSAVIKTMRLWYQETFIRSKREQLANMFDFIERYKNGDKNIEIQNELSEFFDITKLLVRRESKVSLTFDDSSLVQTLRKVAIVKNKELEKTRINMERLLETEDSNKISLFTSLIYLRLNRFNNRNGKNRLLYSLKESPSNDVIDIYKNIKTIYKYLSQEQKHHLMNALYEFNKNYILDYILDSDLKDEIATSYIIKSINNVYESIF